MAKRGNKLIAILVAVIMSAAFLLTCFSVFGVFLKKDENVTRAADLTISTFDQLESFMNNSDAYSGKTVVLANDIDCYGKQAISKANFSGTFDGQGYAIINATYKSINIGNWEERNGLLSYVDVTNELVGLFAKINSSAVIKNLKVDSSYYPGGKLSKYNHYDIGGIVANCDGGTIECCSVENFTVGSRGTANDDYQYVGGIFAVGNAKITNCYVKNFSCGTSSKIVSIGPATDGAHHIFYITSSSEFITTTTYFITRYASGCTTKSTYNGVVVDDDSSFDKYITQYRATYTSWGNTYVGNYDYSHSETSIYTSTDGNFANLNKSNVGGTYEEISYYWYYNPNYNNGWPYLRIFIKQWNSYKFDFNSELCDVYFTLVGESASRSVYGETLYYPGSGVGAFYSGITEELKSIGGNSITETTYITYIHNNPMYLALGTFIVECKTGYNFDYFNAGAMGTKNHTIYISLYKDEYNFEFKAPTINGQALDSSQYTIDITNLSYIEEGSILEVSYSHIGNNLYIKYMFESKLVTYIITVGEYTIDSYGLGDNYIEESAVVPDYGANGTTVTITPTLKLKQYNITFG